MRSHKRSALHPCRLGWAGMGAILSLVLLLVLPVAAAEGQAAVVRSDPALIEIGGGQTVTLNVVLANAQDVYGIDVRATFDPQLVEVVDADPARAGVQFNPGSFPQPDFLVRNEADNQAGTLRYAITQVNPTEPVNGSGVVFSLQLRARTVSGEGSFAITTVELTDRDGALLAVQPESGVIRIASAGAVASTALPTVTNPPAASPTEPPQVQVPTATSLPAPAPELTPSAAPAVAAPVAQPVDTPPAVAAAPAAMPTNSAALSAATAEEAPPPPVAAALPEDAASASPPAIVEPVAADETSATAPADAQSGSDQPDQSVSEAPSYRQPSAEDGGAARSAAADPSRLLLIVGLAALSAAAVLAVLIVVVLLR